MPIFRVHQADDPEIEAGGGTPAEASGRLIAPPVEAIDFAGEARRRQPLAPALADARGFDRSFTAGAGMEPGRSPRRSISSAERMPGRRAAAVAVGWAPPTDRRPRPVGGAHPTNSM